jgi:hypothetical protein
MTKIRIRYSELRIRIRIRTKMSRIRNTVTVFVLRVWTQEEELHPGGEEGAEVARSSF